MNESELKFLSVLVPHLTVTLVFVGLLFHALRRFERRADALLAKYDEWDAESERKCVAARDEIRASMREKVDHAIAEMRDRHKIDSSAAPLVAAAIPPLTSIAGVLHLAQQEDERPLTQERVAAANDHRRRHNTVPDSE